MGEDRGENIKMNISYPFKLLTFSFFTLIFLLSTKVHASYMYNGLEITPSASVQESFDDNITYTKTSPISDAITHLILGLGVKQTGKTETCSLNANIDQAIFAKNSAFDNTSGKHLSSLFFTEEPC